MKCFKILLVILILIIISDNNLFAASAAFSNDASDARGLGNVGAMAARADSPATNWFNPAGLTRLAGTQMKMNLIYEAVYNELDSDYGSTVEAEEGQFFIPSFFYTQNINDKTAFGIGLNAAYGLTTKWDDPITNYVATTSTFKPVNLNPNIAYKFDENFSAAIGLDIEYATGLMKKKINQTFLNTYLNSVLTGSSQVIYSSDAVSKLEGNDTAIGWNTALLYSPDEKINIGLSYRSNVDFILDGEFELKGLNGYSSGIFGGTTYSTDASLKISVPETYTFGCAYKLTPSTTIEMDVEYAVWSIIDELKVKYKDETNPYRLSILNTGNPIEKDWKNTWNYSLAIEHKTTEAISVYGGIRYRPSPVPEKSFDPSIPSSDIKDIAGGFSLNQNNSKWDFVINYALGGPRDISNSIGNSSGTSISGKYKMEVICIGIGYSLMF